MTLDEAKTTAAEVLADLRKKLLTPREPEERSALLGQVEALALLLMPQHEVLCAEAQEAAEGSDWENGLDGLDRVDCFASGYKAGALRDPRAFAKRVPA